MYMNENTFAARLIALREKLQLSERAFSDSIGKSVSYINTLKKENSSPSLTVLTSIIDTYPQVSLYWLALGVGSMYLSDEESKLLTDEKKSSSNKDYKSLFEEYRKEHAELRKELHEAHSTLIDMMKKNGTLMAKNTALRLAQMDSHA